MRTAIPVLLSLFVAAAAWAGWKPNERYCEWKGNGGECPDVCPEFFWQAEGQTAYQVLVATTVEKLKPGQADLWDSGKVETPLPMAEYAGRPLADGATCFWTFRVWTGEQATDWAAPWRFVLRIRRLPQKRPHTRTFIFYSRKMPEVGERYDINFTSKAKEVNPNCTVLRYGLLATMVLPSKKASDLERFCVERGLTKSGILEDMFIHFAEDSPVNLHVRVERTLAPRVARIVPGWDARNDRNGDGVVDDEEFANLANPKATARKKCFARVPIYFWGPPRDDYVMYVGHREYQRFLAEVYARDLLGEADGLFIDTTPATIPGAGSRPVVEYPNRKENSGGWLRDMQVMLARVKLAIGDKLLTANGWRATPFVIDGMSAENWLTIQSGLGKIQSYFDRDRGFDRRGKIQMLQYNPIYEPEVSEFGPKVPVSMERDGYYGLALFYLNQGPYMFYGYGRHPYGRGWKLYVPAVDYNIGKPMGAYRIWASNADKPIKGDNLLRNGGFEEDANGDGLPDHWEIGKSGVKRVTGEKHSGEASACQTKKTPEDYSFALQWVTLKPNTRYTLSGWIKTKDVTGGVGAQLYAYAFKGAQGMSARTCAMGTTPWRRYVSTFTTGEGARGRVTFRIWAVGEAWFDDIQLVEGAFTPWTVLARDFEKALVLVQLGGQYDRTITHDLPGTFRLLGRDKTLGPPIDKISLRDGEAAILIRQ
ncbi:MAG: hypothetical protein GXP25_03110 [Planctomycetes bacterium]|nr:hypothetical protein [Planctomycetota bacterium]